MRRDRASRSSFKPHSLLALGLMVLLAVPLLLWLSRFFSSEPLPGIRIAGTPLPRGGVLEPFLRTRARLWAEESLTVETGYHQWRPTRAELGAELPVADALREIEALGRSPNPFVALAAWWQGRFGSGHELRWRPKLSDEAKLDAYVERVRDTVDRLPMAGSFDPEGRTIAGLSGEALDEQALRRALRGLLISGKTQLHVDTLVTPPPQSFRRFEVPAAAASVLMMVQETEYRPGNNGRATNIELAAQKLNGQSMMPGAELSFNQVVGKRDAARGFAPATELMNGEVVQGIGGGVCQVAGTLHAAAFFAGLMVLEYRPHSRLNQFAYLRPGLDTMVAWPDHARSLGDTKDMRIQNPYPFPVTIKVSTYAKQAYKNVLRVELHGAAKPFRVDFGFQEVDRVPAGEVRRDDAALGPGERRVEQQPLDGIVIMRRRTIYMPTRRVDEEVRVAYPPTPRIVLVGAG